MLRWRRVVLLAASLALASPPVRGEELLEGRFIANRVCPALVSIRKETNPDQARTGPGLGYRLLAQNRRIATHYRIEVPGADPPKRWVAATCGTAVVTDAVSPDRSAPDHVLALSWQPAFCEQKRGTPECRSQTGRRRDARFLSLHGLWPQPESRQYCGVTPEQRSASERGRWAELPALALSLSTRVTLETAMPGTMSFLDRHEWTKHGTCYAARDPEAYFRDSLRLLEEVNRSPVADLLLARAGRTVSTAEIRARFDAAFGEGAGRRVRASCRDDGGRRLITELTLGLRGDIPAGTSLADLLRTAPETDPGCPGGVLDPVGAQ